MSLIVTRLVQTVLVLRGVSFIAFSLFTFVGDPVTNLVGIQSTDEQRAHVRDMLGLDDPVPVQFARFVNRAAHFEFGTSYQQKRAVVEIIRERFPATIELSIVSAILAMGIGIPMGIYTALRRNSVLAQIFLALSLVGVSLPTFLTGISLILIAQTINIALNRLQLR